jgi:hypothetical protein
VIAIVLSLAPAVSAAPGWLPSEERSTAGDLHMQPQSWNGAGPTVATNARGDAVIVWHRMIGLGDGGTVQSAIHRAGSPPTTSPLLNVSPDDYDPNMGTGTRTAASEAVTLDDAGNAYVFYAAQGAGGWRDLLYRRAAPGATEWGPPVTVVDATSEATQAGEIAAATNPSGQTILMARAGGGSSSFVAGPGETPTFAGGQGSSGGPKVVINDDGDVAFARLTLGANVPQVRTSLRPDGGTWQPSHTKGDWNVQAYDIGIDGEGTGFTVYADQTAAADGSNRRIWLISQSVGGTVSPYTSLSTADVDSTSPSMAMNESGEAFIAHQEATGKIRINRRAPDGTITAMGYLLDNDPQLQANSLSSPRVALNDAGDVVIVYNAVINGTNVVRAVHRPAGQESFGNAMTVSASSATDGNVAIGARGDAFAGVKSTPDPTKQQITVRSAGFDASGPLIESVSFPATVFSNSAFAYSVSAVDAWSPITSMQWTFGDGTSASGAAGSKAYTAAGSYTATVTATDSRGHASGPASRNVTVSDPPVTPGGDPGTPGGDPGTPGADPGTPGGGPNPPGDPADPGGSGGPTAIGALTGLSAKPRSFLAARSGLSIAQTKTGTVLSYRNTQPATTTFTVQIPARGYRSGKRCVSRRPRGVRNPKRCTIYRSVKGSFMHEDGVGPNSFRFTGRVGGRTLAPGSYRLTAVAANLFGKSPAARTSFSVKKPPVKKPRRQ